jgi:urease accessory protein
MLEVNAINLHYGAAQALRGITMKAEPGKVTCVLGRNGVGKTSLLDALMGQHPVSSGSIVWEGNDITALKPADRARRGIAYVPQGREIFPLLTVEENLETGLCAAQARRAFDPGRRVSRCFPVLNSMLRRRGGDLSGGQQQQLAIGRALVMRPRPAAARRADRGHPALDHQGHRPRDPVSAQSRPDRDHPGRAVSRFCAGAGRQLPGDGSRAGDLLHRRAPISTRRRSSARWRFNFTGKVNVTSALAAKTDAIFAANRAFGSVTLSVKSVGGKTRRAEVHEAGSLRVRCPGAAAAELEAVLINTAGGIAGGDRFDLGIKAGQGTRLVVTTAAAEKIYRSLDPDSTIGVSLDIASGASLAWLPQETILFDHARLSRTIEVDLAPDAKLVLAEAIVFGRTGMGETWRRALFDRWRVRRGGKLIYAETVRLEGAYCGAAGRERPRQATDLIVALATTRRSRRSKMRALQEFAGEVGASAWNGIAAVRLCARRAALRPTWCML